MTLYCWIDNAKVYCHGIGRAADKVGKLSKLFEIPNPNFNKFIPESDILKTEVNKWGLIKKLVHNCKTYLQNLSRLKLVDRRLILKRTLL
jgi:hypothetical protein